MKKSNKLKLMNQIGEVEWKLRYMSDDELVKQRLIMASELYDIRLKIDNENRITE